MCGISGIISNSYPIPPSLITTMTDIISYRGTDNFGYLAFNTSNSDLGCYKTNVL